MQGWNLETPGSALFLARLKGVANSLSPGLLPHPLPLWEQPLAEAALGLANI